MLYYVIHSYIILSPCDMVLLVPPSHHNGFFIRNSTSIVPIMFQIECFPTWKERLFFSLIFFTWHNLWSFTWHNIFSLPGTISFFYLAQSLFFTWNNLWFFTWHNLCTKTCVHCSSTAQQHNCVWKRGWCPGRRIISLHTVIADCEAFASLLGGTSTCREESSCRYLQSMRGRIQSRFDHHHQFPHRRPASPQTGGRGWD